LHTIRYGAPGISALLLDSSEQKGAGTEDPHWRQEREEEYHNAIHVLKSNRSFQEVRNICIYNQKPAFLDVASFSSLQPSPRIELSILMFQSGMAALRDLWRS
ncbi:MAG: hypothetical protein ACK5XN_07695, partial [Bacteroidota bacterium]